MDTPADDELFYRIALTQTGLIGDRMARQLLQQFHSASEIFKASPRQLMAISGLGEKKVNAIRSGLDTRWIEKEMAFIAKHKIEPLFCKDDGYPKNLRSCADAPVMLYYKGTRDVNAERIVAIIGTRKNTDYGLRATEELIEGLRSYDITVVSGLAFGIDIIAHRKAIQLEMPTIGVLAHGLDTIYPGQHKHIAKDMIKNGGLLTEYPSGTNPDRFNFPMRNRIVAGMADVTIVVETELKGGAMITAKLAAGYNREVAAFPGRTFDVKSSGCNYLVKTNMAQMITSAEDLLGMMNWEDKRIIHTVQPKLFAHLSDEEKKIAGILEHSEGMHVDELYLKAGTNCSKLASLLLTMELGGILKSLPGKRYRLI